MALIPGSVIVAIGAQAHYVARGQPDILCSLWVRWLNVSTAYCNLVTNFGSNIGWGINRAVSGGATIHLMIITAGPTYTTVSATLPDTNWHHVMAVLSQSYTQYDPTGWFGLYLDGAWQASHAIPAGTSFESPTSLRLGVCSDFEIADVGLWSGRWGTSSSTQWGGILARLAAGWRPTELTQELQHLHSYTACVAYDTASDHVYRRDVQMHPRTGVLDNSRGRILHPQPALRYVSYSIPATVGLYRRLGLDGGFGDLTAGLRG